MFGGVDLQADTIQKTRGVFDETKEGLRKEAIRGA